METALPQITPTSSKTRIKPWRIAHSEASLGWGGQERRIITELTGFRSLGSQVFLLAPVESQIYGKAQQASLPVERIDFRRLFFPFEAMRIARWLRKNQIQIVNTHSSRDGWLVGLAGRMARVPLIIRSRHFDVPIRNPRISKLVYCYLADHLVTTSPIVTEKLRELFRINPKLVTTVSTGIDLQLYQATGPKANLPGPPGVPFIGIIGIIRQAKGHNYLLDTALLLNQKGVKAHYLVVGDGPMEPAVRERCAQLQLDRQFSFLGYRDDVPDIIRALTLVVIPSLHECVPQVALQAMASGIPVLGSNVGGIPSVVHHGQTGRIFPPANAAALAQAIQEALDNQAQTRSLAEAGKSYVQENHSIAVMLHKMNEIYEQHFVPQQ